MKNIITIFKRDLKGLATNFFALVVAVGLCLLPDVFQEYEQEKCGEPMVSQKRNEGAQLVAAAEETFCRTQGL